MKKKEKKELDAELLEKFLSVVDKGYSVKKEKKKYGQGYCGNCGSRDVDYGAIELEGESAYFPFSCLKCKERGQEWYSLTYEETWMEEDEE